MSKDNSFKKCLKKTYPTRAQCITQGKGKYELPYLVLNKPSWLEQQHSGIIHYMEIIAWLQKECTLNVLELLEEKATDKLRGMTFLFMWMWSHCS